jgi:hypothetical protein
MSTLKRQQKQVRNKSKNKIREFEKIHLVEKEVANQLFVQPKIKKKKSQKISKK